MGGGLILLGHSALDPSSLSACQLATAPERFFAEAGRRNERNQTGCNDRADCIATQRRRRGRRRSRNILGRKETPRRPSEGQRSEGNRLSSPTARNHGRFQARPQGHGFASPQSSSAPLIRLRCSSSFSPTAQTRDWPSSSLLRWTRACQTHSPKFSDSFCPPSPSPRCSSPKNRKAAC